MNKYYAIIDTLNNSIGKSQCPCSGENIVCIEITQEIYDNIEKYIYIDGELILDPDYEGKQRQKERERLNLLSLTKREVFLAIYKDKGITPEQIRAMIPTQEGKIEFDYANDYFRGNPLIEQLGLALGYTTGNLDYLFENGEFEVVDDTVENTELEQNDDTVVVQSEGEEVADTENNIQDATD